MVFFVFCQFCLTNKVQVSFIYSRQKTLQNYIINTLDTRKFQKHKFLFKKMWNCKKSFMKITVEKCKKLISFMKIKIDNVKIKSQQIIVEM